MEEINELLKLPDCVMASYIKATCPKAFAKCIEAFSFEDISAYLNDSPEGHFRYWESKNYGMASRELWSDRALYDFFDNVGIPVQAQLTTLGWWPYPAGNFTTYHPTRKKAETVAFTNAFYELEKQLS